MDENIKCIIYVYPALSCVILFWGRQLPYTRYNNIFYIVLTCLILCILDRK